MGDRDSNLVEKEVVLILMMLVQTKQKTIDIEKCNFFHFFLSLIARVLLVEAGGKKPWIGSVPGLVAFLQKSPVDWAYTTEVRKVIRG